MPSLARAELLKQLFAPVHLARTFGAGASFIAHCDFLTVFLVVRKQETSRRQSINGEGLTNEQRRVRDRVS